MSTGLYSFPFRFTLNKEGRLILCQIEEQNKRILKILRLLFVFSELQVHCFGELRSVQVHFFKARTTLSSLADKSELSSVQVHFHLQIVILNL